jgi:hypothetical protein
MCKHTARLPGCDGWAGHYHTKCVENELLTISNFFHYLFDEDEFLIDKVGKS